VTRRLQLRRRNHVSPRIKSVAELRWRQRPAGQDAAERTGLRRHLAWPPI